MKLDRPVIDGHVHLEKWFDENGKDFFDGFDEMQNARGLKAMNIAALPIGERDVSNNIMAAFYKLHNPSAFACGGITYPEYPVKALPDGADPLTQYRELMEIGFDGMKNLETKPEYHKQIAMPPDSDIFAPYFAQLEKDGTHLLWHVCDPETFWDINRISKEHYDNGWYYGDGSYASNTEVYNQVFNVLKRHPKLHCTFAHFFFYSESPEKLEALFAEYPNVGVDITPGSEMYESFAARYDFYREFFIRYADRISFGTDSTFPGESEWLSDAVFKFLTTDETFELYGVKGRGLKLPEDVCARIMVENFRRNYAETPRPVNKAALKRYIEKYAGWIRDKDVYDRIAALSGSL